MTLLPPSSRHSQQGKQTPRRGGRIAGVSVWLDGELYRSSAQVSVTHLVYSTFFTESCYVELFFSGSAFGRCFYFFHISARCYSPRVRSVMNSALMEATWSLKNGCGTASEVFQRLLPVIWSRYVTIFCRPSHIWEQLPYFAHAYLSKAKESFEAKMGRRFSGKYVNRWELFFFRGKKERRKRLLRKSTWSHVLIDTPFYPFVWQSWIITHEIYATKKSSIHHLNDEQ